MKNSKIVLISVLLSGCSTEVGLQVTSPSSKTGNLHSSDIYTVTDGEYTYTIYQKVGQTYRPILLRSENIEK